MAITPLPTPPSRATPLDFSTKADAFLGALPVFVTEANAQAAALELNSTTSTSTTSVVLGLGSKSLTVTTGRSYQPGMSVKIARTSAPSNWMHGDVTSYVTGTGALVVNVTTILGSGTFADWTVTFSAPVEVPVTVETDIASAATTAIGGVNSDNVRITGTTTITSFGTVAAGIVRAVRFAGALILTHNGTSLILPGGANITTAAGDTLEALSLGGGNWVVRDYMRASGVAVVPDQILPISASVGSNALTISASSLTLDFRSTTLGSGAVTSVSGTPANLVVPSTATLGTISAVQSRLAVLAMNNAGTIELAVVNTSGGNDLSEADVVSTTAIAAGSNTANVIYSTTARTGVAYRVIGYVESTQATAGTWATAPSTIQGAGGQAVVRTALNASGAAPMFACRAWVNFNGTGTVAIRASGNVSSITDNGVGNYTVNFTTAMPDNNYVMLATVGAIGVGNVISFYETLPARTVSSITIHVNNSGTAVDVDTLNVAIFR